MTSILLTLLISYILLFLFSLRIRDNSIVDVFWGGGFVIIALLSFSQSVMHVPQIIITWLVVLWGVRIVLHIGLRKLKEWKEDARYAAWREVWGSGWYFYIRSFLQIYMLQMILMIIIATPIYIVNQNIIFFPFDSYPISSDIGDGLAIYLLIIFVWGSLSLFGLIFESIADRQLREFIQTKKSGEIFVNGLYRYSRHPNYFGESVFWLGISLISLPFSYYGMVSFLSITILLVFVSGVPLQEARYAGRANWEEYKARTSIFVPWFPK